MEDEIDAYYCYFISSTGEFLIVDYFTKIDGNKENKEKILNSSINFAKSQWKENSAVSIYCIFEIYNIKLKYMLKIEENGKSYGKCENALLVIEMIRSNPELGKIHLEKGMI